MALTPLADMLNSRQPSPAAGPIVSPLTSPLTTLLPDPASMSQSNLLTSLLTGPLSSHLASPMAAPPAGTLASSLGLPSTGPLTPSSSPAGPQAVPHSSPLMGPVTGTVAGAAPLGVSQNLLADPMSNLVLSEAPGVRMAAPLQGGPSGPHPSAGVGTVATSKGNRCRAGWGAGRGPGGRVPPPGQSRSCLSLILLSFLPHPFTSPSLHGAPPAGPGPRAPRRDVSGCAHPELHPCQYCGRTRPHGGLQLWHLGCPDPAWCPPGTCSSCPCNHPRRCLPHPRSPCLCPPGSH